MGRIGFSSRLRAVAAAMFLAAGGLGVGAVPALAQSAIPAPGSDGATPAVPPPVTVTPPASTPGAPSDAAPGDVATEAVERLSYPLRPTAAMSGNGDWDTGFQTISDAFAKL